MLNWADYDSFSDLFSIHVKTINHLNLKFLAFSRHAARLKIEFLKFRILKILTFTHKLKQML